MAIPKQVVQFFFGATDEDTSAKGVKLGDLVLAQNVQQLHGGEFIKRGGIYQTLQSYSGDTVEPDSLVSPDGVQAIIHDLDTDGAYVATGEVEATGLERPINQPQGASLRLMPTTQVRFPARERDTQAAPMCKQSGDFYAFLVDDEHIRVVRQSADGSTMIDDSGSVAVYGPKGTGSYPSTHIKSFALVNTDDFDIDHLWIFWVDWSTNEGAQQNTDGVWALKFSKADLTTHTKWCVVDGGTDGLYLTSISASIVGNGRLVVAQVGNIGHDELHFRGACASVDWHAQHFYFASNGARSQIGYKTETITQEFNWCASGCCMLTVDGVAAFKTGYFRYAAWLNSSAYQDQWMLTLITVPEDFDETGNETNLTHVAVHQIRTAELVGTGHGMGLGAVTGYETATGVFLVAQMRYYCGAALVDPDGEYTSDRLYTMGITWLEANTATIDWTARGAWLAHGWLEWTDGTRCVITGYEDPDALQVPYHLRNAETGQILAQFSYGEGAHAGGTATSRTQVDGHWSDINQPMIQGDSATSSHDNVVLATQSANVTGTTDIVSVLLDKPAYQNPAAWGNMALVTGPVPTIVNGWQKVTEAGPLTAPPRFLTCYGTGNT
jgi:hypothetical protein